MISGLISMPPKDIYESGAFIVDWNERLITAFIGEYYTCKW
jgi:hypothetical protein